jgi:hypothetical protein
MRGREQMIMAISTAYGAVEISEDELQTITNEELVRLRISREELHRCFAKGMKLMKGRSDIERPIAVETFDGKWEVHIVRYSSDPFKSFID